MENYDPKYMSVGALTQQQSDQFETIEDGKIFIDRRINKNSEPYYNDNEKAPTELKDWFLLIFTSV